MSAAALLAGAEQPLPQPEAPASGTPQPATSAEVREPSEATPAEAEPAARPAAPRPAESPPRVHERPGLDWQDGVRIDPDVRAITGIGPHFDLGAL